MARTNGGRRARGADVAERGRMFDEELRLVGGLARIGDGDVQAEFVVFAEDERVLIDWGLEVWVGCDD